MELNNHKKSIYKNTINFSKLILRNKQINMFENCKQNRVFINIIDVISSIITSIDNEMGHLKIINFDKGVRTLEL